MLKGQADYYRRKLFKSGGSIAVRIEIERIENRITELTEQKSSFRRIQMQTESIGTPKLLSDIPRYLIERRLKSGLTQEDLAKAVGMARQTLIRYERTGYVRASLGTIIQIDAVLRLAEIHRQDDPPRFSRTIAHLENNNG